MLKKVRGFIGFATTCFLVAATNASAAITGIDTLTLNTADVDSIMALVIVGLATLWGFRKVIKTMNRS